jgi:hypothetical protein
VEVNQRLVIPRMTRLPQNPLTTTPGFPGQLSRRSRRNATVHMAVDGRVNVRHEDALSAPALLASMHPVEGSITRGRPWTARSPDPGGKRFHPAQRRFRPHRTRVGTASLLCGAPARRQ